MLGAQTEACSGPEDLVICFLFRASPLLGDTCCPEFGVWVSWFFDDLHDFTSLSETASPFVMICL